MTNKKTLLALFVVTIISFASQSYGFKTSPEEYRNTIQKLMNEYSDKYGAAFQMAVVHQDFNMTLASGVQNHKTGQLMTVEDKIPEGSVIKPYTIMTILRLIDQGLMGFNDTISSHVDRLLIESNGTTLLDLWKDDSRINDVTLYELMHMKSGLGDYSDEGMFEWTMKNPDKDFTPLDYLHNLNKTFICNPGECEYYSSVGISLLAFAAAQYHNASSWDKYDQFLGFPQDLQKDYFNGTLWLKEGKCSDIPAEERVTHQYYGISNHSDFPAYSYTYLDLMDYSCLDGWGFGNIAVTSEDISKFFYQYLGTENIISDSMKAKMLNWEHGEGDEHFRFTYGLGLMRMGWTVQKGENANDTSKYTLLGHAGMDWASFTDLTGYSPEWKFSLTNGGNAIMGLNCNLTGHEWYDNWMFQDYLDCNILNETLQFFSEGTAPKLNCTSTRWVSPNPNPDMVDLRELREFKMNRNLRLQSVVENNQEFIKKSNEPVCYPYCEEYCNGRGPCAKCHVCLEDPTNKICGACRRVSHSGHACLDTKHGRCETCWKMFPPTQTKTLFLQ